MFWIPWMEATRWRRWLVRDFTLKLRDSWVVGDWLEILFLIFFLVLQSSSKVPSKRGWRHRTQQNPSKTTDQNPSKSARHRCVGGGMMPGVPCCFRNLRVLRKKSELRRERHVQQNWHLDGLDEAGLPHQQPNRWFDTIINVDALFPLSLNAEVARKNLGLGHREFLPVSASMRELAAANDPVCKSLAHVLESFCA